MYQYATVHQSGIRFDHPCDARNHGCISMQVCARTSLFVHLTWNLLELLQHACFAWPIWLSRPRAVSTCYQPDFISWLPLKLQRVTHLDGFSSIASFLANASLSVKTKHAPLEDRKGRANPSAQNVDGNPYAARSWCNAGCQQWKHATMYANVDMEGQPANYAMWCIGSCPRANWQLIAQTSARLLARRFPWSDRSAKVARGRWQNCQ